MSLKSDDKSSRLKEVIFYASSGIVIPYAFAFLYQFNDVIMQRQNERPDLVLPSYSHLFPTVYWIGTFLVLRFICSNYIFNNIGNLVVSRKKWSGEVREEKLKRFGHCLFKLLWFVGISTYSYFLLRNKEWFPPSLGGKGVTATMFDGYPWIEVDESLRNYFMIQLAYHSHSLIYQFTLTRRGDFLEMFLHHVVTIALITFSYLNNYLPMGCLVFFIHDITDIFAYLMKVAVDSQHIMLNVVCYYLLVLTWLIGRLTIYPFIILYSCIIESLVIFDKMYGWLFFNVFLICLLFLHIYWFYLFMQIGKRFYNRGQIGDGTEEAKKINTEKLNVTMNTTGKQ